MKHIRNAERLCPDRVQSAMAATAVNDFTRVLRVQEMREETRYVARRKHQMAILDLRAVHKTGGAALSSQSADTQIADFSHEE